MDGAEIRYWWSGLTLREREDILALSTEPGSGTDTRSWLLIPEHLAHLFPAGWLGRIGTSWGIPAQEPYFVTDRAGDFIRRLSADAPDPVHRYGVSASGTRRPRRAPSR